MAALNSNTTTTANPVNHKPDTKTQPAPYANDTPTPAPHTVAPANIKPPDVPNYDPGNGGKTVVNTKALDTFSSNLNSLIDAAHGARGKVAQLASIAPGAFDKAWTMQFRATRPPATQAARPCSPVLYPPWRMWPAG